MIVPILLVAMVIILFAHGYLLHRSARRDEHGVFSDTTRRRLDTRHWTSVHGG